MEKTISAEERIRRAEEIYYRRKANQSGIRMPSSQVKDGKEKRQFSFYKKMVLQILICILIYLIFSLIKEANYLFSEDVINKTKEILNKDINFQALSSQVSTFFQKHQEQFSFITDWWSNGNNHQTNEQENGESNTEQNTTQTNEVKNNNEENESQETNNQTTGIGGANTNEEVIATASEDSSEKTQMQIDAQYIKENFDIGLPLQGQITSRYGKREPTEIISENHQGIDIGVDEGTSIVAAMEGKVTVVSNEGDYGTHVKIVNQDITTIYAHCSKILVKEGETVKKGQQIALSGNTGNTTGPHLHFEIRREDRTVDPELVVSWANT